MRAQGSFVNIGTSDFSITYLLEDINMQTEIRIQKSIISKEWVHSASIERRSGSGCTESISLSAIILLLAMVRKCDTKEETGVCAVFEVQLHEGASPNPRGSNYRKSSALNQQNNFDGLANKDKTPIMHAVAHKDDHIINLLLETKGLDL
jgi:hypothetical protein